MGRGNTQAKRRDETEAQFLSRRAREAQEARDRNEPIVPVEAQPHFERVTVMHVETNTRAESWRAIVLPSTIERWHKEGRVGFEEPAMDAMRRCIAMWEARPMLGSMAAQYKPVIAGGANDYDKHIIKALDDTAAIEAYSAFFHPAHWRVFENVVRYDKPLADEGMENNGPQSTASARAIVGTVANFIAAKMRC